MKLLAPILFILYLTATNHAYSQNDFNGKLFKKHFTRSERKEIARLVIFCDSLVNLSYDGLDIDKDYHRYLDSMWAENTIGFDRLMAETFLFSLNKSLFDKIWTVDDSKRKYFLPGNHEGSETPDDYYTIELNVEGEYVTFLKYVGDTSEYFKEVATDITSQGGLSPTVYAEFFNDNRQFNFMDPVYRLWAAIILLSIDEPLEVKLERFNKK